MRLGQGLEQRGLLGREVELAPVASGAATNRTSGEQTSLFIAPPLIIEDVDLLRIVDALDAGLGEADEALTSVS